MKTLTYLSMVIASVMLAVIGHAQLARNPGFIGGLQSGAASGSNPPASPLVKQNFEGTGYDNGETWNTYISAGDPDYTGIVLLGSQSLSCFGADFSAQGAYTTFSGLSELWGFVMFEITTNRNSYIVRHEDSGAAAVFNISVSGTNLRVDDGSANATTSGTFSLNTPYYLWWHRLKGSGANAVSELWFSSTPTKPADGSSGHAKVTTGTTTTDAIYGILLNSAAAGAGAIIFDHYYIDDAVILDNP